MWSSKSFQQAGMHASAILLQDKHFHKFIIVTIIMPCTHDAAIG